MRRRLGRNIFRAARGKVNREGRSRSVASRKNCVQSSPCSRFSRSPEKTSLRARNHPILRLAAVAVALALCAAVEARPQAAADCGVRVTLLQVNDVYQILPVDRGTRGGLPRVAALRKKIQAESAHTLLVLAGDTISPSVASNIFKGRQMIAAWNAVGLDFAVLGNHEFDFGDAVLLERIRE